MPLGQWTLLHTSEVLQCREEAALHFWKALKREGPFCSGAGFCGVLTHRFWHLQQNQFWQLENGISV